MAGVFYQSRPPMASLGQEGLGHNHDHDHAEETTDQNMSGRISHTNSRRLVRSSSISSDYKRQTNSNSKGDDGCRSRTIVRSSSISSDYTNLRSSDRSSSCNARTTVKRSSSMSSAESKSKPPASASKGKKMLRSVASFLFRGKRQAIKRGSFSRTRPASPASVATLSRSNSNSSSSSTQEEGGPEAEGARTGAAWHSKAARPQVSFDVEVQVCVKERQRVQVCVTSVVAHAAPTAGALRSVGRFTIYLSVTATACCIFDLEKRYFCCVTE